MERIHKSGVIISPEYLSVKSMRFQAIKQKTVSTSCLREQRWRARRGADSGEERHSSNNREKARYTIDDYSGDL